MNRELHAGMNCVSIIGMAAAGKSTVGRRLADALNLAHVDADHVIESVYGVCLQQVADNLTKDAFLDMESAVVSTLHVSRTVISPGGSVVYREVCMRHLASLGPIIHVDVPLSVILERIARKPDRGLAIAPGQTIDDLYNERSTLYHRWADFSLDAGPLLPDDCVSVIRGYLTTLQNSGRFSAPYLTPAPEQAFLRSEES